MFRSLPNTIKKNIFLFALVVFSTLILFVSIRINNFRYNNFDYGKFDLGNMTQMMWNATQGNNLMLTDYFGTNLPRWAMSHVDPILYIFVPLFAVIPHALTLVYSQLVLVIFSSVLIYLIAKLHFKSTFAAFLIGMSYLFYPAVGYLIAWSGFHGVTAVIPFFLAAVYIFEKMYKEKVFTNERIIFFWIFLILTMMGKEQLSLYTMLFGVFIVLFRCPNSKIKKLGMGVIIVSLFWFIMAFFVIIPLSAHYRIDGYTKFVRSIKLDESIARDVALPNYFLSRYDDFGDSYGEVAINMILNPNKVIKVFFGGDRPDNLSRTFMPLLYLPLACPTFFILALPDLAINYLTTAGGIGTAEISNHRISMIIPVLFISTIFSIKYFGSFFGKYRKAVVISISGLVLAANIVTTFKYNNPVYLWLSQAVRRRVVNKVFAKSDIDSVRGNLQYGDVVKLSELEDKDRECALKVVGLIPEYASVSGPDSLGTHLAQRETYAIFPALYNEADYVIVDVFARKILTILDMKVEFISNVVEDLIKDENYSLRLGCGNYFVFQKSNSHKKNILLSLQHKFEYEEKFNYDFFQGLRVVDYSLDKNIEKNNLNYMNVVYQNTGVGSLEDYFMFTTFVHKDTGEIYQMANLPSFAIAKPEQWKKNRYYLENVEFVLPDFVDDGEYMVFVGMSNKIRTRSIYLGDIIVK